MNISSNHPLYYRALPPEEKDKIKVLYGHATYGYHQYVSKPYAYITVFRDPVDRIVSAYYYLQEKKCAGHPLHRFVTSRSLIDCFDPDPKTEDEKFLAEMFINHQTRIIAGLPVGDLQGTEVYSSFLPVTEVALETAKSNLMDFGFIGFAESIDTYGDMVSQKLGKPLPPVTFKSSAHRMNPTASRPVVSELDTETLNTIIAYNQLDLQLVRFARQIAPEVNR